MDISIKDGPGNQCYTADEFIANDHLTFVPFEFQQYVARMPTFPVDGDKAIFFESKRNWQANVFELKPIGCWSYFKSLRNAYISVTPGAESLIFDENGSAFCAVGHLFKNAQIGAFDFEGQQGHISDDALAKSVNISEKVFIYADEHNHNYYHWFAECLLGLFVADKLFGSHFKILPYINNTGLSYNQTTTVGLIYSKKILAAAPPDSPAIKAGRVFWGGNRDLTMVPSCYVQDFARTLRGELPYIVPRCRGIFIKRVTTRRLSNETDLEDALALLGIRTFVFDHLRIHEQIAAIASADLIVSVHGAGLTNMLFARPGTKILEIMPSAEVRAHFWVMADKLNLPYGIIMGTSSGESIDSTLEVDVDHLIASVEKMETLGSVYEEADFSAKSPGLDRSTVHPHPETSKIEGN